jgi:pyruvate dehydrogenase E2 component (dihydrolipoamide acetyltransferase)
MPTLTLPSSGKASSGTVRRWLKRPGDLIHVGEVLLELENDDGLIEVESAVAGKLEQILAAPGKSLVSRESLAVISEEATPSPAAQSARPAANHGKKMKTAASPSGKVTPILMPQAGQSMEEGTLIKWHVAVGDLITKGDIIFEIDTDKAAMEVEATESGQLARIVLPEGGTLKVLEPVAYLADDDADVDAFLKGPGGEGAVVADPGLANAGKPDPAKPVAEETKNRAAPAVQRSASGRVKASPAARRIASERGIDLAAIGAGSGPQGRILSADIPASSSEIAPIAPISPIPPIPQAASAIPAGITRRRISAMRKAIGRALTLSKQTVPHFYVKLTVDAESIFSVYQAEKAKYPCSLNDLVVSGCARAVSEFPAFRSRIDGDEIVEFPTSNIGIAVAMDDGLVVPVLIGAEKMTLRQIGSETRRLAAAARSGKIEGMGQGVFTITNLGMFGVEEFSAIINPPEAAILAVGAVREEVIVSGGALRAGRAMTVMLSADHRIIDGALAARFMARLKEILESAEQYITREPAR